MTTKDKEAKTDNGMAKAAAQFFAKCLFPRHRGVIDCGDKIV